MNKKNDFEEKSFDLVLKAEQVMEEAFSQKNKDDMVQDIAEAQTAINMQSELESIPS